MTYLKALSLEMAASLTEGGRAKINDRMFPTHWEYLHLMLVRAAHAWTRVDPTEVAVHGREIGPGRFLSPNGELGVDR